MGKTAITIITMLALLNLTISAQKPSKSSLKGGKAKTVIDKTKLSPAERENEATIMRMIASTQKIIIIDSIVTEKESFLNHFNMNPEAGSIGKYNQFFSKKEQPNTYIYVNEMGNKCYYALEDSIGNIQLYTSDRLGNQWSQQSKLNIIHNEEDINKFNYPFVMADGTTLYFAAEGKESIGGLDIFVTRYDADNNQYLKPENIGMPFNSIANDYMLAIDEMNNIGWFVSDRNQTEGKVCIYIFIPTEIRKTYQADGMSEEQISNRAKITCIADTWGDGTERRLAMERLKSIAEKKQSINNNHEQTGFVINDEVTYHNASQFQSKEAQNRFIQLEEQKTRFQRMNQALDKARNYYATASQQEKNNLRLEISNSERKVEELEQQIYLTEKEIRNMEIKKLQK
jgi:hypothetical protein